MKELEMYRKHNVQAKGVMKDGILYIVNRNDEDGLYYASPLNDLDVLKYISKDVYLKDVVEEIAGGFYKNYYVEYEPTSVKVLGYNGTWDNYTIDLSNIAVM